MTSITYTEFISLFNEHKYIIDRKSTQFVDDHSKKNSYSGKFFRNISNLTILQAEYFKIVTWWDKLDFRFGISI